MEKNSQKNSAKNLHAESDEELVEMVKMADDRAFRVLVERYMGQILNFARQYARASEDADDIAQESFFKAWRHIRRFKKGKTFRPWLYTITRNTALDHLKKRHAHAFSELDDNENDLSFADTLSDSEPLAPEMYQLIQEKEELTQVLSDIHPEHRAVLLMHYTEEMTFEEIAVVVGKPMNTVKSWHRRALIKLRHRLNERGRLEMPGDSPPERTPAPHSPL